MFVASYRASEGGEAEEREPEWKGFNGGRGLLLGGGDGIDQVKYFTTHFRRCARRVAPGVGPDRETEGPAKKCVVQFHATETPVLTFHRLNMDFRMRISLPEISNFIIDKGAAGIPAEERKESTLQGGRSRRDFIA